MPQDPPWFILTRRYSKTYWTVKLTSRAFTFTVYFVADPPDEFNLLPQEKTAPVKPVLLLEITLRLDQSAT